jgi:hypothetical protein
MSEPADARSGAPRRTAVLAGLTVLLSSVVSLAGLELGLRGLHGAWLGRPAATGGVSMLGSAYPGAHHPTLGYVPKPGVSLDNVWDTTVSISADGVRRQAPLATPPYIVAVGDSYTFGDQVSDADTWPARLERELGRPVVNGGVFGYGLDQIVLRAEQLLERFAPDILIVSLIPDDIRRCEYSYRYAWKPYFEAVDDGVVLRNVPVPEPHVGPPGESAWRRGLRSSFLADFVMRRLDPDAWALPDSVRVHRQGAAVSRALLDRLADAATRGDHRLLLLLQWHPYAEMSLVAPLLDQAKRRGVDVLALEPELRRAVAEAGSPDPLFRLVRAGGRVVEVKHMTPEGNAWVAAAVARHLGSASGAAAVSR